MDCDVRQGRQGRGSIIWIHFGWLFWRYVVQILQDACLCHFPLIPRHDVWPNCTPLGKPESPLHFPYLTFSWLTSLSGWRTSCPLHLRVSCDCVRPNYSTFPIHLIFTQSLEIIIWFVPSVIGDAVAVSLVGMLLGPMFPIAMNHAGRVLPRWLLTGSISWITGFGQVGSVMLPFVTGAFASRFGVKNLQPL
jgi:hypothetical protein